MTPQEIGNTRDDRFQDLCKLSEKLGYGDGINQLQLPNGSFVSSLIDLLEDNPGAVRALIDWLADNHGEEEPDCESCGMFECECCDFCGPGVECNC